MPKIIQPAPYLALPYEPPTVRSRYEQTEMYFMISPLGKHPAPSNSSFCTWDGYHTLLYCKNTPSSIQNGGLTYDASAVIFEITGKIRHELCFITTNGDCGHPNTSEEALVEQPNFASCWLEVPGDTAEDRTVWCRALQQLEDIALCANKDVHMQEFLEPQYSCTGRASRSPALFQVSWLPPQHSIGLDALPLFNARYEHILIPSLDHVPFDRHVHVRFMLHLGPGPATHRGGPIIGAEILYMHIVD
ncbi:hypothetical protein EWM64_g1795 [Hericium alpestre]|uniref:Uncharacterized protein n=1 Tax=Hericium alpestre TaxID=135208 RepID=A0A4Z0A656_9AGAM|nr:hypothetical protein EWM64_g1795 [Hericium alpestre]